MPGSASRARSTPRATSTRRRSRAAIRSSGGDGGVQVGGYDPKIHYSEVTGAALGYPDQQTLGWFGQRSQAVYGAGPEGHVADVPTLLDPGHRRHAVQPQRRVGQLRRASTSHHPSLPVKLIAFCGGHVSCPTGAATDGRQLQRHRLEVEPGGRRRVGGDVRREPDDRLVRPLPARGGRPARRDAGARSCTRTRPGTSIPRRHFPTDVDSRPGDDRVGAAVRDARRPRRPERRRAAPAMDTAVTDGATNSSDPGQVTVPVLHGPAHANVPVVGIGHVTAKVTVDGAATELFFRLIDENTGDVVDLQTQPLRVDNLDLQGLGGNADVPRGRSRSRSRSTSRGRHTTCPRGTRSSSRCRPRPTRSARTAAAPS